MNPINLVKKQQNLLSGLQSELLPNEREKRQYQNDIANNFIKLLFWCMYECVNLNEICAMQNIFLTVIPAKHLKGAVQNIGQEIIR